MLVIMDGWGFREEKEGNAVLLADTPNLDGYGKEYPFTLLKADGEAVGLPMGQMGNSEVGHLNLGAGRIVYQELTRINMAIKDGSFFKNSVFSNIMQRVKKDDKALHLMGLVSEGGVHSQMGHLFALLKMAKEYGITQVFIHAFMDGRDTIPTSGAGFIEELQREIETLGCGKIATIVGRYYAMDRDKRWDRVKIAYDALVHGAGRKEKDPVEAVKKAYLMEETDEFIKPVVMEDDSGTSLRRVQHGDGVIFFNFRADRARELTRAFMEKDFQGFDCGARFELSAFVTMTRYDEHFALPVAFPPQHLKGILGEVVSKKGLSQLRMAETEKYAHVTYFFNGGEETPFPQEDRVLIPSPRDVATYDERPEMSAYLVAEELIKRLKKNNYSLVVVNFANGDMVGHTGVLAAAVKACEAVDACVGRITRAWLEKGGAAMITSDHGNAETMTTPQGGVATAHTNDPVPFYFIDEKRKDVKLRKGILADIAPTILSVMGLPIPEEMTGQRLF
jgi:2,3-bisphosphoglycerate-independent phosphoglycerate mutase